MGCLPTALWPPLRGLPHRVEHDCSQASINQSIITIIVIMIIITIITITTTIISNIFRVWVSIIVCAKVVESYSGKVTVRCSTFLGAASDLSVRL